MTELHVNSSTIYINSETMIELHVNSLTIFNLVKLRKIYCS